LAIRGTRRCVEVTSIRIIKCRSREPRARDASLDSGGEPSLSDHRAKRKAGTGSRTREPEFPDNGPDGNCGSTIRRKHRSCTARGRRAAPASGDSENLPRKELSRRPLLHEVAMHAAIPRAITRSICWIRQQEARRRRLSRLFLIGEKPRICGCHVKGACLWPEFG